MKAKKIKGFMVLPAVLMSILLGLLGLSFLQIYSGQFSALSSSRTAVQAQQFAQSEADRLRNTAYDSLSGAAHARTAISGGNGWQSLVSLGAETTVNEVKQRMATVNVYRNGTVTTPDFSLQIPLSSAGGSGDNFPVGTILPYVGDVKKIPAKWALCNGSNGTPNLNGRFLEGTVSASQAKKTKEAGLPNIIGSFGPQDDYDWAGWGSWSGALYKGAFYGDVDGRGGGSTDSWHYYGFDASRSNAIYGKSTTVQPNSYTVMYIMKIKA